jgi:putative methyltransferase (TIGR04325 family)
MRTAKEFIRMIFSDYLISRMVSIFYGWRGNFCSWEDANSECTGYNDITILEKVSKNARKVKNGEIPYERDSVAFDRIDYSFPLLAGLMWIASKNDGKLNVLDYGGSLGTSYYQNKLFLKSLSEVNWCIIEQPHFVEEGRKAFKDDELHFFYTMEECLEKYKMDLVLLSNMIMYLEKPYTFLEEIVSRGVEYIILDRTLLLPGDKDRLTVQKVPKKIYKAKYCCWFLSESKIISVLNKKYDLIYDFDIKESINIKRSLYKGYFFKRKE